MGSVADPSSAGSPSSARIGRGLTWLDTGGPSEAGAAESVLTAFPVEQRAWRGKNDGALDAFLDGMAADSTHGARFSVPLASSSAGASQAADGRPGEPARRMTQRGGREPSAQGDAHPPQALRFQGGWIGYLCYEAIEQLEPVQLHAARDLGWPVASWAHHPTWYRYLPGQMRLELWTTDAEEMDASTNDAQAADDTRPSLEAWVHWAEDALRAPRDRTTPMWAPPASLRPRANPAAGAVDSLLDNCDCSLDASTFEKAVMTIQGAIREGEVFQANLAQRLRVATSADPFEVYIHLRRINPSPYACFIEEAHGALVSNSPERLFCLTQAKEGRTIGARPIAGTRPRSSDDAVDTRLRQDLLSSDKERAEHTMLVDLARNDLGRVSTPGSVRVTEFQTVEKYSHVHHLVSDVTGTVQQGLGVGDIVRALFPGGTITGAPKLRSIEVIDRLEPVQRGPYTGSAGYINPDGSADWNILIRTMLVGRGQATLYVGAGIVADSVPEEEYRETLHKAGAMLEALATVDPGCANAPVKTGGGPNDTATDSRTSRSAVPHPAGPGPEQGFNHHQDGTTDSSDSKLPQNKVTL